MSELKVIAGIIVPILFQKTLTIINIAILNLEVHPGKTFKHFSEAGFNCFLAIPLYTQ